MSQLPSGVSRPKEDHLPGGASRGAALLLSRIPPVFSVVAPGPPARISQACHVRANSARGAALRDLVLLQPRRATSRLSMCSPRREWTVCGASASDGLLGKETT